MNETDTVQFEVGYHKSNAIDLCHMPNKPYKGGLFFYKLIKGIIELS